MFKFLRNLTVFGLLYAGYKWLTERFHKEKLVAKDKTDETENAGSTEEPPRGLSFPANQSFQNFVCGGMDRTELDERPKA